MGPAPSVVDLRPFIVFELFLWEIGKLIEEGESGLSSFSIFGDSLHKEDAVTWVLNDVPLGP